MAIRRVALALGILFCIAAFGHFAYRSSWVRGLFVKDEDPVELSKLAGAQLAVAPVAEPASGWPQWRGPLRDGRAPAGPFRSDWDTRPPTLVWSTACGGGYSSLAVVNGKVYTQDRREGNERVICLNALDGKQLWDYSYPADPAGNERQFAGGPRATPTVEGNNIYAVGGAGKLLCLEASQTNEAPTVRWQHDLLAEFDAKIPQWGVACSPLIDGNLLIVQPGGKKGSVVAFDKSSGSLQWAAGKDPSGYSSPVVTSIGGRRAYFALTSDNLVAINAEGKLTDSYSWETQYGGNIATPLIVEDYVFISAAYGQGCALLRAERHGDDVKLVQVYARRGRGLKNHHCTSVYKDRYLFGFDGEAGLKCVELNTGNEKKSWEASGVDKGSITLADKHLIIQTEKGELCLVEANPEEFRLVAKLPKVLNGRNNWASPTLVDGRLYLRDDEKIVCYDVAP